jgi:hypothetical protein
MSCIHRISVETFNPARHLIRPDTQNHESQKCLVGLNVYTGNMII